MKIRELAPKDDAAALVQLHRDAFPTAVITIASFIHREATVPARARARAWVAELDGEVVGRVECLLNFFSQDGRTASVNVIVRGDRRGRGIGTALYETALAYVSTLEAECLLANFHENDAGVAFATARGFRLVRSETEASLDPRRVAEQPDPALELRAVDDVDARLVHAVDLEATTDMPATVAVDDIPYGEWEDHVLRHPLFTGAGSFVAMVDGVAAAVSLLTVDLESGRAASMFTGTRRAYRGRGLALAAKLASIHWAAGQGVTQLVTYNDTTNAPMLAINRRLGYVPSGRRVEYLADLPTS
jgi:GNAT superfamily N-acetyltransferase